MTEPSTLAQPPQYAPRPRNGLGTAALVLGIIAIPFGLMPITGWLAIVLALIGLPLGIAGAVRVSRHRADNKVITWVGTGLSTIGLVLGIWASVMMGQIANDFVRDMDQIGADLDSVPTMPATPYEMPAPVDVPTMPAAPVAPPVAPVEADTVDSYTDGQYLVGEDMEAGTYKSTGTTGFGCYWAIYNNGVSDFANIANNHMGDGPTRVTVEDGQLVEFQGCAPFTKTG